MVFDGQHASACNSRTVGSKASVASGQSCSLDSHKQSLPVPSPFWTNILLYKLITTASANQAPGGNRHLLWVTPVTGGFHCLLEGAESWFLAAGPFVQTLRPCWASDLGTWTGMAGLVDIGSVPTDPRSAHSLRHRSHRSPTSFTTLPQPPLPGGPPCLPDLPAHYASAEPASGTKL